MHPKFNLTQVERFKREAKAISKARRITHAQALDSIAETQGWPNWSLLVKHHLVDEQRPFLVFARESSEVKASVLSRGRNGLKYSDIEDIFPRLVSALNAVTYAIAYVEQLLALPRYKIAASSRAYKEMRSWLPYRIHETSVPGTSILVNRMYKPVGMPRSRNDGWVDFDAHVKLHVTLSSSQIMHVCDPDHAHTGGLFGDGGTPWVSRASANAYLRNLRELRALLMGRND